MLDSECERVESGWLSGEPRSDGYDAEVTANRAGLVGKQGHTRTGMVSDLWDYIDRHHRHSPIFTNFTYTSQGVDCVSCIFDNISIALIAFSLFYVSLKLAVMPLWVAMFCRHWILAVHEARFFPLYTLYVLLFIIEENMGEFSVVISTEIICFFCMRLHRKVETII